MAACDVIAGPDEEDIRFVVPEPGEQVAEQPSADATVALTAEPLSAFSSSSTKRMHGDMASATRRACRKLDSV